jgi:hypothetical protein
MVQGTADTQPYSEERDAHDHHGLQEDTEQSAAPESGHARVDIGRIVNNGEGADNGLAVTVAQGNGGNMQGTARGLQEFLAGPAAAQALHNGPGRAAQQCYKPRGACESRAGVVVSRNAFHGGAIAEPVHQLLQLAGSPIRYQRLGGAGEALTQNQSLLPNIAPHVERLRTRLVEGEGKRNRGDAEDKREAEV